MGMSIDNMINQIRMRKIPYDNKLNNSIDYAIACIKSCESLEITARKYIKLQADYENRLKADMVAMLTEIQLEIKELWDSRYDVWLDNQYYIGKSDTLEEVDEVVQKKINELKENTDKEQGE